MRAFQRPGPGARRFSHYQRAAVKFASATLVDWDCCRSVRCRHGARVIRLPLEGDRESAARPHPLDPLLAIRGIGSCRRFRLGVLWMSIVSSEVEVARVTKRHVGTDPHPFLRSRRCVGGEHQGQAVGRLFGVA
jgi:hypothetical protein